jgi:hypothetical protein
MTPRQINTIGKVRKHVKQKGTFGIALLTLLQVYGEKGWDYFTKKTSPDVSIQKQIDTLKSDFHWHCKVQESEQKAQVEVNKEIKESVIKANDNLILILKK